MMRYQIRYITPQIEQDLARKMVFVGGPRQVGKTTLAKHLLAPFEHGYLNWDIASQREAILKHELPNTPMWVFDEIHKYKKWRNYLKGIYDEFIGQRKILVTGSACLDYYRRGGDSLQGRYHYLRLLPLSVAELEIVTQEDFMSLYRLGGFPEQFLLGSEIESKRWGREYRQRLIQEDLFSVEQVRDLGTLELLMIRLPDLVGSPLSINAVREDLQVSHKAVESWLNIFERLYAIFRLPSFGSPLIRAVKKEQKHYHYDWTLVDKPGPRFENMVAVHLLKWVWHQEDTLGRDIHLRYFRDIDKREVDFVIVEKNVPIIAIECKWGDDSISPALKYFKKRFSSCEAFQLTMEGKKEFVSAEGIRVCSALKYLSGLI